ncbi:hypothetical protein NUW54_g6022 [Trametes sanguinea]|uniref:Uncharacterized protein n=1 Tax=Trametes sanguinea TaxID=158606 RepID=A0ACC1PTH6_9APHY|nr:hypothetical protein NUW54_g6022 [Trametes sanguinea]
MANQHDGLRASAADWTTSGQLYVQFTAVPPTAMENTLRDIALNNAWGGPAATPNTIMVERFAHTSQLCFRGVSHLDMQGNPLDAGAVAAAALAHSAAWQEVLAAKRISFMPPARAPLPPLSSSRCTTRLPAPTNARSSARKLPSPTGPGRLRPSRTASKCRSAPSACDGDTYGSNAVRAMSPVNAAASLTRSATTALIPRFCRLLESGALDAYSASDIRRLIDCERDGGVRRSTRSSLPLLLRPRPPVAPFLELNQPRFDPAAIPARRRYLTRRYKLLRNLLQWRRYAGDRYGLGVLATRLVTSSMLPVAETGWEVGGEEIMRKVAQALPTELVPPALQGLLRAT